MSASVWTWLLFLFVAPGFAFLTAFSLAARCRRQTQPDGLRNVLTIFITAAVFHILVLTVSNLTSKDQLKEIAQILTLRPCIPTAGVDACQSDLSNLIGAAWEYGVWVVGSATFAGLLISKLVAWGWVKIGFFYGPLYPIIRGFLRRHIIVTVISKVATKAVTRTKSIDRDESSVTTDTLVMYRGLLDELRLDHNGRIEYLSLLEAGKGPFVAPKMPEKIAHASDFFEPIGKDETLNRSPIADDELEKLQKKASEITTGVLRLPPDSRLIIEGEDIQNVWFARVSPSAVDAGWRLEWKLRLIRLVTASGLSFWDWAVLFVVLSAFLFLP